MPSPFHSRKILVVEDEGLIAHDIAQRLEALGHQVVTIASTAEEAIEHAPAADLILMDIRIDGDRDGIEAAQEIRTRFHVPVIFLTSHADRETLDRAKAAEPFGYIVKPLGPSSLQTAIEMATYKHKMDRQLEEREAWLRTTVSSAAEALIVTDVSGRLRLLNPAAERITGWRLGEAAGQPLESVLRLVEANGDDFGDPSPLAILRGSPIELDRGLRAVSRGGREVEVEGTASPVISPPDTLGVVITLRDVSLRRWEERQLRQAQRMETAGRLAARVSAEYALLIESIRTQAETLLRQLGAYAPAREAIENIQRTATSAAQATRRLADFGTRQVTHPEVLSINAVVRRLAKLIESAAGSGITTAIRSTPEVGRVRADSGQIEQAVLNMVLHACQTIADHSPAGQSLSPGASKAEAWPDRAQSDLTALSAAAAHSTPPAATHATPPAAAHSAPPAAAHAAPPAATHATPSAAAHATPPAGAHATPPAAAHATPPAAAHATPPAATHSTPPAAPGHSTPTGKLLVETNRAEAPRQGRLASFVVVSVTYSAPEPDLDHLFDPDGADEAGLALSVAHSIATEHGGYLLASAAADGTRLDLFLPRAAEELAAGEAAHLAGNAPAILLVDYRDRVREQLHNFFEDAGYNLIEAATREEAVALGQLHEGAIDLLVAETGEAEAILKQLGPAHPEIQTLCIVDQEPSGPHQIRRPFTQTMLLDRADALLAARVPTSA